MEYVPMVEEITTALDHVFYEIQQLTLIADKATSERPLNNAIVESRLLHVRNLLNFFEHSPTPKDDVLSTHYGFPASRIDVETQDRERLNKDLAHLTYSRTQRSEADKVWPHGRAVLPVLTRCRSFAEYVLKTRTTYGSKTRGEDWHILLADMGRITQAASR